MKKWSVLLVFLPVFSFAQTADNGQDLVIRFFEHYKKSPQEAFQYALSTNKWLKAEGGELQPIAVRLSKTIFGMGEFIGYEEIRTRSIGSRFRVVNCLVYYERDPVLFIFELYKNNQGWEFANVSFDAKFEREMDDASRVSIGNYNP